MAVKVRDLAKELGVSTGEILEQLQKLYVDAEDEKSKIDDKIAGLLRHKLGGAVAAKEPPEEKKKAAAKAKPAKKTKAEAEKKPAKAKKETRAKEEKPEKAVKKPVAKKAVKAEEPKPEVKKVKKTKPAVRKIQIVKRAEKPVEEPKVTIEQPAQTKPALKKGKKAVKPLKPALKKIAKVPPKPAPVARKTGKVTFRSVVKKETVKVTQPAVRKTPLKIALDIPISIRDLAPRINQKPNEIIQYMMKKGALVSINQDLEEDIVRDVLKNFGYELELAQTIESIEKELVSEHHEGAKAGGEQRAPVVTFMGHVDHGKTSLLDYIRNTMVVKKEKGGITQHIGAYKVETVKGSVAFLDTPGHEAFTAMRARGANVTDVVVLVVAADDGVMPQTKEAIDHARAANVPIVVAINKCDLAGANPDKVKRELQQEDLAPEDWGGETIMVHVSAKTGEGVDNLVEMLMLESELLELRANPELRARGIVIEGKKTPGQGVVATLLVMNGTLRPGDVALCGAFYGRVKAMLNEAGDRVEEAPPATPVEVLGLQGVPEAGEEFFAVKDEKKARTLALLKQGKNRKDKMAGSQRVTLEDFHSRIAEGSMKELKIILKADVQGSIGAIKQSLENLSTEEVKVDFIHDAVGNINESDVMLAMVSNAVIIGFHVKVDTKAEELAKAEKIDVHLYDIIYEATADVKAAMEGLLEPEEKEVFQGRAQIREVFSTKTGKVAGCMVIKGTIHRKDRIRVKRGEEIIHEGDINALKRFKDDVRDVKEGFECGISLRNFNNIRQNDVIEAFIIEKIARRLEK